MAPRVRVLRTKYGSKFSFARLNYRALTAGIVGELCEMLGAGSTMRVAADAIGVGSARVLRWVEDGSKVAVTVAKTCDYPDGATPYDKLAFRLFVETERAKALRVQTVLRHLETGMIFDWRAAAWWLERQAPDFAAPSSKPSASDSAPRANEEPAIHFYIPENGRAKV